MSDNLTLAITAAKKGAEKALSYFQKNPEVTIKSDQTPVTIADKQTEEIIKQTILQKLPHTSFVGEETGGTFDKNNVWIIDPIDGTRNYIRGVPFWSILIAHFANGIIDLGVSYTPLLNELLYAEKDKGAFLNETRIHVSDTSSLTNAYVSFPGNPSEFQQTENVLRLLTAAYSNRGFGDAYAYHLVANGRIDVNFEPEINVWDVAPFKVIIEEAGGMVTNLHGNPWTVDDTTVVASNGKLQKEVIEILNLKQ